MIPKIIHYCWFGRSEKPVLVKRCIDSWKLLCPDYQIIEWNEENFDVNYNDYTRYCYENKKWAFLSDFVRLHVVCEQGGLYFDTDVELVKRPDELLKYDAFYGFETPSHINTGLGFGAIAHHKTIEAMRKQYFSLYSYEKKEWILTSCPKLNTMALVELGLNNDGTRQNVEGAEILPIDFLNPYDDPTGKLVKTDNTISIHWYCKSWLSKRIILRSKITKPFHRIFGVDCFKWLKK